MVLGGHDKNVAHDTEVYAHVKLVRLDQDVQQPADVRVTTRIGMGHVCMADHRCCKTRNGRQGGGTGKR